MSGDAPGRPEVLAELERALLELPAYDPARRLPKPQPELPALDRTWLMGVPVDVVTQRQTLDRIFASLDWGRGGWVVTPNLDILRQCQENADMRRMARKADLVLADGQPLVWASRIAGAGLPERVAGSDLVVPLCRMAAQGGRSVFLLGGNPGVADEAAELLKAEAPGLEVAGTYCPPFGFEHDELEVENIRALLLDAQPDIVLVALGAPKQEHLIERIKDDFPATWFLGVGITFSFLTGEVRRAPKLLRKAGLEWAHRLAMEPRRLADRYLREGLPFAARLGMWAARKRWFGPGVDPARRTAVMRRSLAVADLVAAMLAILVLVAQGHATAGAGMVTSALLVVLSAKMSGLYDRDELVVRKSTVDELPAICRLALLSTLLISVVDGDLGRAAVLTLAGTLLAALIALRAAARTATAKILPHERCLVIGCPEAFEEIAPRLERNRCVPAGFLALTEAESASPRALEAVVRRGRIDRVVVAAGPEIDAETSLAFITRAKTLGTHVTIVPRMFEVVGSSVEFDHVDGMVMLGVHRFGLTRSSALVKRGVDLIGATLALAIAAPVMAVAALAIKLDSGGPILFRQTRVGRDGVPFTLLKFRSMVVGADEMRDLLAPFSIGEGLFKMSDDPRITRVGRILRRMSLDELPQLINVLRGEMSLVGPRPLVEEEDRRIAGWHRRRLHLTPGLTGPWQVLGRSDSRVALRDMVTIDYLYAANWSPWSDVKVLLRTILHVCRCRGI